MTTKAETPAKAAAAAEAAHDTVLAVPCDDRETLVVTGSDRGSWLNGLVTSDLAQLGLPGKASHGDAAAVQKETSGSGGERAAVSYGLFVGRNGRILADVYVVFEEARALASVPREAVPGLLQHLDHYLVMEDAEVAADTNGFASWMLHGPASTDVLAVARRHGAGGGRIDRTGHEGAFVLVAEERRAEVGAALEKAIAEKGGILGDANGWEALRLERGVPRFGVDFDDKVYPQEAGLEQVAVSFSKGCYLGQEVVCMLEMRGHVKRKLAKLVLDGAVVPARGVPVTDEAGAAVGEITSAAVSPSSGKPIAFAMLKRTHIEPGTRVLAGGVPAQVRQL